MVKIRLVSKIGIFLFFPQSSVEEVKDGGVKIYKQTNKFSIPLTSTTVPP